MSGEEIKLCDNIDLLELQSDKAYRDCCDINDCSQCWHYNEGDVCDLELITRRIAKLEKTQKEGL